MAEKSPEYDVYDPEIRTKLAEQLLPPLRIWGEGEHPHLPEAFPHYERDLIAALDYTGASLDGYVMARFLEDSRRWPADQDLVAILSLSKELASTIASSLKNNSSLSLWIGGMVVDVTNTIYKIVSLSDGIYTLKYGPDWKKECTVSQNRLHDDIEAGRVRKVNHETPC